MGEEEKARDEDGTEDEKADCLDNKDFSVPSPKPASKVADASEEDSEFWAGLLSPSPKRSHKAAMSPKPAGDTSQKKKGEHHQQRRQHPERLHQ